MVSWLFPQLGPSSITLGSSMLPMQVGMGRQKNGLKEAQNTLKKEIVVHMVGNANETLKRTETLNHNIRLIES